MKHPLFISIATVLGIGLLLCGPTELSSTAEASPSTTTSSFKKPIRVAQATDKTRTPARSSAISSQRDDGLTGRKLKTLIFGEGDDIEGATRRPTGEDVTGRTAITHTNLIRIRQHFLPELYKSAEHL